MTDNWIHNYTSEELREDKIAFAIGHLNRHTSIQNSKIDTMIDKMDAMVEKTDATNEKLETLIDAIDGLTDALERIGDILAGRL